MNEGGSDFSEATTENVKNRLPHNRLSGGGKKSINCHT